MLLGWAEGGGVVGGGSHVGRSFWCALVVAVPLALGGCDSGGGETAGETNAAPKTVLPPVAFSATAEGFSVRLSWNTDPASASVEGFEIKRNGRPLTSPSETSTSYTDTDVRPGKKYAYEIRARGESATSEPVTDEVKIRTPSLEEARFEGDFGVSSKIVSQSGYGEYQPPAFGLHVKPRCRRGPCDVVWRNVSEKSVHGILEQKGKDYSGRYSGFFGVTCQGTHSTSSVDIALTVANAKAIDGEWRATKLEGTVEHSEAIQFGCRSGQATLAIKALLRATG
jgi:hypothetical protein